MQMRRKEKKLIFLNQMAGPLFRELSEDLAKVWPQSVLFTGHPDTVQCRDTLCLHIEPAPGYDRRSYFSRFLSWFKYFFKAFWFIWKQPEDNMFFIVSNPPFLGVVGLFFKCFRKQEYVILVYDVYPDLLVALRKLKKGVVSKCWDYFNRIVYENASQVMTIDQDMGRLLKKKFDILKTKSKKIVCIPPWADIEVIKPIDKKQNRFALKYNLLNKTTVLYSGNMGHSHDIKIIIETARKLSTEAEIHFLFIGEGSKWSLVEKTIEKYQLKNITLLPFQPEEVLPLSMTTGDIGIVTYENGTQGCMSPSKAYYYMAAGLPIIVISGCETDLTRLVKEKECGIWLKNGDIEGMTKTVKELSANLLLLSRYKKAARKTAEQFYSRKNSELFVNALKAIG